MPNILKQLQVIDEHNVLPWFTFSGTVPVSKGTFVKIATGYIPTEQEMVELGNVGYAWDGTVSQRYGVAPKVATVTSSGDATIGFLRYDVRETDENGEKLIFKPDKAARMQAVLSGQAVPVVTKGVVLYSGVEGTITVGGAAYLAPDGSMAATSSGSATLASIGTITKVGTFLGPKDGNGWVLVKIDL